MSRDAKVGDYLNCGDVCLVSAYVLAKLEAGKEKEVIKQVNMVSGVQKACATYGTHDLVIEVTFESIDELDEFVFSKLRKIPQVKETITIICSETITIE